MIEAAVLGRVGVDLAPPGPRIALASTPHFVRAVGGYAGNVAVGLARLGVATAIVSAVGDDGHGEHVRSALAGEGIDVDGLVVRPGARTQVAFFEAWPPETFPVTFHRDRPAPETRLVPGEVGPTAGAARLVLVSGALLAEEPARTTILAQLGGRRRGSSAGRMVVLDLDWRPTLWPDPDEAPDVIRSAVAGADVVIGSDEELAAHGLTAEGVLRLGPGIVALKHGSRGSSVVTPAGSRTIEGRAVEVVCGLGAGDAFAASFAAGLLRDADLLTTLARANAAGAIVASRMMCSTSMPTPSEIDAVLAPPAITSRMSA